MSRVAWDRRCQDGCQAAEAAECAGSVEGCLGPKMPRLRERAHLCQFSDVSRGVCLGPKMPRRQHNGPDRDNRAARRGLLGTEEAKTLMKRCLCSESMMSVVAWDPRRQDFGQVKRSTRRRGCPWLLGTEDAKTVTKPRLARSSGRAGGCLAPEIPRYRQREPESRNSSSAGGCLGPKMPRQGRSPPITPKEFPCRRLLGTNDTQDTA